MSRSKQPFETPLAELDIAVSHKFASTEEWERLENDPIARDVFLAIGSGHLRGPEFFEDAFRFSDHVRRPGRACQHCGKPPTLETAQDLLDALRAACHDGAMNNPWRPQDRSNYWPHPTPQPETILREEMGRELRLRELLAMVKCGIREFDAADFGEIPEQYKEANHKHVKFHVMPAPPEPPPILNFEI